MPSSSNLGFAVIYRWRLDPEKEDRFCAGWSRMTRILRDTQGALGSRLHRAEDGSWVAYAQWPSRNAWEIADAQGPEAEEARDMMKGAVTKGFPPILLDPLEDLLVPTSQ